MGDIPTLGDDASILLISRCSVKSGVYSGEVPTLGGGASTLGESGSTRKGATDCRVLGMWNCTVLRCLIRERGGGMMGEGGGWGSGRGASLLKIEASSSIAFLVLSPTCNFNVVVDGGSVRIVIISLAA